MIINFEYIKFKNFLSTGNREIKIDFRKNKTIVINGENGAGKSLFIDALTYNLYGKPYRKIKIGQLVNNINERNLYTESKFTIGNDVYIIRRGIKPTVFEIEKNGKILKMPSSRVDYQNILEKIINIPYKIFIQIVVLGKANFVPFMQLSLGQRREIIEKVLGLEVFSDMSNILKRKIKNLKKELSHLENKLNTLNEIIKAKKDHLSSTLSFVKKEQEENEKQVESYKSEIIKLKSRIKKLTQDVKNIDIDLDVEKQYNDINIEISNIKNEVKKYEKKIKFYETNEVCVTCGQKIDSKIVLKESKVAREKLLKRLVLYIDKKRCIGDKLKKEKEKQVRKNYILNEIVTLKELIEEKERYVRILKRKKKQIQENSINDLKKEIADLKIAGIKLSEKIFNLKRLGKCYLVVRSLLKDDGIKKKIISNYIPIINDVLNNFLDILNFRVNFLFNDVFEESIYSNSKRNFTYFSFSEGEKERINLALLLTWREILARKSQTTTNILIFDEIFDGSLDSDGIECFLNILKEDTKTNHIIISHKAVLIDGVFDGRITMKKVKGFTQKRESV